MELMFIRIFPTATGNESGIEGGTEGAVESGIFIGSDPDSIPDGARLVPRVTCGPTSGLTSGGSAQTRQGLSPDPALSKLLIHPSGGTGSSQGCPHRHFRRRFRRRFRRHFRRRFRPQRPHQPGSGSGRTSETRHGQERAPSIREKRKHRDAPDADDGLNRKYGAPASAPAPAQPRQAVRIDAEPQQHPPLPVAGGHLPHPVHALLPEHGRLVAPLDRRRQRRVRTQLRLEQRRGER